MFVTALLLTTLKASDMVHSFRSPAFNGIGYSSHMLTIENLARTRKQSIKDVAKAEAEQAKLPAHAVKMMKDIEDRSEELRRITTELMK